jgi:L-alanine-DL-glutamate epimerase-like enolase superfamily enzyme
MKITEVRATTIRIPLSTPIVMGELKFDGREYLVLEIVTDEGLTGLGFGMTRDAPLAAVVAKNIAPRLLGMDALASEKAWQTLYDTNLTIGQRGIFMRCLSAVDIALWDIKAQAAGMPLWQLLGGVRERIPVSVAGGYPRPGRTLDSLGEEVARYASQGYPWIKIAAGPLADDTERLAVSADAIGDSKLAYDAHWAWRTLPEVVPTVRTWDVFDIAFIEDPFPSDSPALAARLRERTGIPLALGEDVTGRFAYRDLIAEAMPEILRLDATSMGGISEAVKVCAMAAAESIPVLPHIFPELHVHLAAALPIVMAVEVTDPVEEIDLLWNVLENPLRAVQGHVTAPTAPGLGVNLDREALKRFTTGVETLKA